MGEAILRIVLLSLAAASVLAAELTEQQKEPVPSIIISSTDTTTTASATLQRTDFLYTMQFSIGGTTVAGIMDTGSDLIWTNNSQVLETLPDSASFCARLPFSKSCSCNGLCTFEREYGHTVEVKGVMGQGNLTFDSGDDHRNYSINLGSALNKRDCQSSYASGGIVGLGLGNLSLVRQLRLTNFSYCLPPDSDDETATGLIKFNDTAAALEGSTTTKLKRMPGLKYPESTRYYVGLKKVRVCEAGDESCKLKNDDDSCGDDRVMFIDSGTPLTHLPKEDFEAVKKHAEKLVPSYKKVFQTEDGSTCYQGKYDPKLLPNNGMDSSIFLQFCSQEGEKDHSEMEIPARYYFYQTAPEEFCLAFKQQKGTMSILGAYQQWGMHMRFNIQAKPTDERPNTLTFARAPCDAAPKVQTV